MNRKTLIETVEALDKIKMAFNATDGLDFQTGAYGKVAEAMTEALAWQFGRGMGIEIYRTMIDNGISVREAIDSVYAEKGAIAPQFASE